MKSVTLVTFFAFFATMTNANASVIGKSNQASTQSNRIAQNYPSWAPKCNSWWDAINCAQAAWWTYDAFTPCDNGHTNYACQNPNQVIPSNDNNNQYGQTEVCDYNGRCTSTQNHRYYGN